MADFALDQNVGLRPLPPTVGSLPLTADSFLQMHYIKPRAANYYASLLFWVTLAFTLALVVPLAGPRLLQALGFVV